MNLICGDTSLTDLIAIFSAIFAGAGLFFAGCQTRQNRKQLELNEQQLKLNNYLEYNRRYQEIIIHFPDEINDMNFPIRDLNKKESRMTMKYMQVYFNLCSEEYSVHKKGLIDADFWDIWKDGMRVAFSKPAFKEAWRLLKNQNVEFGNEFEKFAVELGISKSS